MAKYNKTPKWWILLIYAPIYMTVGIIFYDNYLDIIPIITPIIFTVSIMCRNMQTMKKIMLFPNIFLIFYALMNKVYPTAILDFLDVTMLAVAIIKNYYATNKNIQSKKFQKT